MTTPPGRILVLTTEYPPTVWGGLGTYTASLVHELLSRRIGVDVLLRPSYRTDWSSVGARIAAPTFHSLGPGPRATTASATSSAWVAGRRWSALLVQDPACVDDVEALVESRRVDRVVTMTHLPSTAGFSYFTAPREIQLQERREARLYRLSTDVVAPSRDAARAVVERHAVPEHRVHVNPEGCDLPPVSPAGGERDHDAVVSVGRLVKQKGIAELAEVIGSVRERRPRTRWVHVGSGPLRGRLDPLVDSQFTLRPSASRDHVARLLGRSAVFVSTAVHETFGLACLEAMWCGAVPVHFSADALDDLVVPGGTGIRVRTGAVDAMADAVIDLLDDRDRCRGLSTQAVHRARTYSVGEHVDGLLDLVAEG